MASRKVTVIGADKAALNLRTIEAKLMDFTEAFEDIGEDFRYQAEMQFRLRGALPGIRGPWEPLSPRTIYLRGGSNHQLVRFENLMNSYSSPTGSGNISQTGVSTARFGSGYKTRSNKGKLVPTASMHQTGTRRMPSRPVVLANVQLDEEIVDAFSRHIFSGWIGG